MCERTCERNERTRKFFQNPKSMIPYKKEASRTQAGVQQREELHRGTHHRKDPRQHAGQVMKARISDHLRRRTKTDGMD